MSEVPEGHSLGGRSRPWYTGHLEEKMRLLLQGSLLLREHSSTPFMMSYQAVTVRSATGVDGTCLPSNLSYKYLLSTEYTLHMMQMLDGACWSIP